MSIGAPMMKKNMSTRSRSSASAKICDPFMCPVSVRPTRIGFADLAYNLPRA